MPTYDYLCDPEKGGCKHRLEVTQSIKDTPLKKCPKCGKLKLIRLIGLTGLIFSGSDWTPKFYGDNG